MSASTESSTDIRGGVRLLTEPSPSIQTADVATMPPLLLTTTAAGQVLGVSKATVWRMIARGVIPYLRFRDLVRVPADELQRWMSHFRLD